MTTMALTSPRRLSGAPSAMPMRRVLGAYLAEARFETVRHLKAPAFALPFLIIPVALYLFFSTVALNAGTTPPDPALRVPIRMFTGLSATVLKNRYSATGMIRNGRAKAGAFRCRTVSNRASAR